MRGAKWNAPYPWLVLFWAMQATAQLFRIKRSPLQHADMLAIAAGMAAFSSGGKAS